MHSRVLKCKVRARSKAAVVTTRLIIQVYTNSETRLKVTTSTINRASTEEHVHLHLSLKYYTLAPLNNRFT